MSETRVLLITDIVDSTAITELLGTAAAAELWTAHDRLSRDLLATFRGREIDKADGLLLLFSDADDALRFASAYHHALETLTPPLKARVGLHVGAVSLRENAPADVSRGAKPIELDGIAKATTARIACVARAGQTLLSMAARQSLRDSGWRIRSHGHWRLKGVAEPAELFEAGTGDIVFDPPADHAKAYRVVRKGEVWLPMRQVPHRLPAERDAFVGRQDALDELARQYESGARLVSLTGMGGTGKTRLATRFAWSWLGEFPGGAWFCDLAQVRSIDGIAWAVAQALDVPLGKEDPIVQLGNAIAGRGRCLLVLDNFEQIASYAEPTLGQWLERAGDACFLVTTRGVLGIGGESIVPLAPLPPVDGTALFMRRAQSARRGFAPSGADQAAIAPLVKLLDGLPLAIEMAAARVRIMAPSALLSRMSERFRLLAGSSGRPHRQATLRATFDWSWDLLSLPEKAALAQLSVFNGGFTLASAEAVLDLSRFEDAPWPLDAFQSLVEKSFVRQAMDDRFELLVSVQEYAREHLGTVGRYPGSGPEAVTAAESRHLKYFASIDERQATAQRCVELGNVVLACRRAVAHGDAEAATRTLELAWAGLRLCGPFKAGEELAALVATMPDHPDALLARINLVAGRALQALGRVVDARLHYESALVLACAAGEHSCEGRLRSGLGSLDVNAAKTDQAREHFEAALKIGCRLADRALESEAHRGLGTVDHYTGRIDEARSHYDAALKLARQTDDRRWEGGVLGNLGNLDVDEGKITEARGRFEDSLIVARELGNRQWEGNALCNLGLLHHSQGQMTEAWENLQAAVRVAREMGHARLEAIVLCNLGIVREAMAELDDARQHYEAALVIARCLNDRRSEGQFLGYLGGMYARMHRFDEARHVLKAGEELLRTASDSVNLGVLLCGRAEMEWLLGAPALALDTFAEAEKISREVGAGPGSELGHALSRVRLRMTACRC